MKIIVAVDSNWGIGYKGNLLFWIPEDLKLFKQMTLGKVVVMGRETFESLPNQEPLKDRINIVLSKNENFNNDKINICRSLDGLFNELEKYDSDDVFIIGGESIYFQLLDFCNEAYVTKIEKEYVDVDKYFIDLDEYELWRMVAISEKRESKDVQYRFTKYIKRNGE